SVGCSQVVAMRSGGRAELRHACYQLLTIFGSDCCTVAAEVHPPASVQFLETTMAVALISPHEPFRQALAFALTFRGIAVTALDPRALSPAEDTESPAVLILDYSARGSQTSVDAAAARYPVACPRVMLTAATHERCADPLGTRARAGDVRL